MKKILIVDDEPVSLMMTEHILSTSYQTITAASGEEAIPLYEKEHPQMVLSDLRMPGISGLELQSTLEKKYNMQIPFMFMTADHDDDIESKGFENGAMDFIRKPFRSDVLLRRVDNILQTVEKLHILKSAAQTDQLTGLLNKTSAAQEIGFLTRSAEGVLMIVDLDSFKLVNDLYGHSAGDEILIAFADIIKRAVRSSDIVGRIGGDEFITFCLNVTDDSVLAEKSRFINEQLVSEARRILGEDMNIPLGASLGCVYAPEEGGDYNELFKKADKALYFVKQNGKHGYNVYRNEESEVNAENGQTSDIQNIITIFSERNLGKGALVLPTEKFRLLFQFLIRINKNYSPSVWIVLFTLTDKEGNKPPCEEFMETLSSSLRQSDLITQSGKNQVVLLLMKMESYDIASVIDRIMENWKGNDKSAQTEITYELDVLK